MASLPGGNDPFRGGAQQRNLRPPGVGGADLSANTNVSSPAAGVNPGTAFSARNNSGSNIGIPYLRLVPLNNEQPLGKRSSDGTTKNVQTETQSLRATTLAFILGKRSKFPALRADPADGDRSQLHMMHTLMPGMPGTERFQALCSYEYLKLYFKQVLSKNVISLDEPITKVLPRPDHTYPCPNGKVQLQPTDTLLNVRDIAKDTNTTMAGSEMGKSEDRYQGIYARDVGPFLRGKGVDQAMLQTTTARAVVRDSSGNDWVPCLRSRNAGDEMAFAALNQQLSDMGMHDWQPDGIVLSKGADDPSDAESDDHFKSRDGILYNVRVQGPAITTTWTGDSSMETLPMDRVFCVIVADVWFDPSDAERTIINNVKTGTRPAASAGKDQKTAVEAYEDLKKEKMEMAIDTQTKEQQFVDAGLDSYKNGTDKTVLTNFRIQLSTSSQMVNYSHLRHSTASRTINGKRSRMGLKLSMEVGEYIVGGWTIGNVLDTSASRAVMPNAGSTVGVRTAPNSAALNVNVQIGYWDSDRMWRTFMNREGTTTPRYQKFNGPPKLALNRSGAVSGVDAMTPSGAGAGAPAAAAPGAAGRAAVAAAAAAANNASGGP